MKPKTKSKKAKVKEVKEKIYFVSSYSGDDECTKYTESELKEALKNNDLDSSTTVYEITSYKLMEIYDQPQALRTKNTK